MRRSLAVVVLAALAVTAYLVVRPTPDPDGLVSLPATSRAQDPAPRPAVSLAPAPSVPFVAPRALAAAVDGCSQAGGYWDVRWHVDLVGGSAWTAGDGAAADSAGADPVRARFRAILDTRFFTIRSVVVSSQADGRRERVGVPREEQYPYELSEVCT